MNKRLVADKETAILFEAYPADEVEPLIKMAALVLQVFDENFPTKAVKIVIQELKGSINYD